MPAILFVCKGNQYRSPLAAAFFYDQLIKTGVPGTWVIESAGTWTEEGKPPSSMAIRDGNRFGVDIKMSRTHQVNAIMLNKYDLIVAMEVGQKEALQVEFPKTKEKIYLLSEIVDGYSYDIPDPIGKQEADPFDYATELHELITRGFEAICKKALNPQPRVV